MSDERSKSEHAHDPRLGACAYLLHGLLQRLDGQQPGLIDHMIEGVTADRAAIDVAASASAAHGGEVADEALRMLRLMRAQLTLASEGRSKPP